MTSAHVIALVALFISIGGTALAAATIDSGDVVNNSLKSKDLKDGKGVKGTDVADASLGTADLADSSVTSAKVLDDALTGGDIDESTLGAVPLAKNLSTITVKRVDFTVNDGAENGATATCAAGQQAIAGGVRNDDADTDGYVEVSRPVITGTDGPVDGETFDGWRAFVFNQTDGQSGQTFGVNTLQASVYAVCVG
jgi:hypothetical protein